MAEPELDHLITTLIVESGCAGAPDGAIPNWTLLGAGLPAEVAAARDALIAHIAATYVRWDHLQDEWDEMERSRTHFALPEESPGPPLVAGPLSRRAVRIRLSERGKEELTDAER